VHPHGAPGHDAERAARTDAQRPPLLEIAQDQRADVIALVQRRPADHEVLGRLAHVLRAPEEVMPSTQADVGLREQAVAHRPAQRGVGAPDERGVERALRREQRGAVALFALVRMQLLGRIEVGVPRRHAPQRSGIERDARAIRVDAPEVEAGALGVRLAPVER